MLPPTTRHGLPAGRPAGCRALALRLPRPQGASVAALAELQSLGPALAIPLLEFGEPPRPPRPPPATWPRAADSSVPGLASAALPIARCTGSELQLTCCAALRCTGLSVYQCELAMLRTLRPTVVLTCLQDAHGSVLEGELLRAALLAGLGYEPQARSTAQHSIVQHITA